MSKSNPTLFTVPYYYGTVKPFFEDFLGLAAKKCKDYKDAWVRKSQPVDEKQFVNKQASVMNTCSRWFCGVFTAAAWARVSN
jgi:hypothetical protein